MPGRRRRTNQFVGRQRRTYARALQRDNPRVWRTASPQERDEMITQRASVVRQAQELRQQSERAQRDFGSPQNVSRIAAMAKDESRKRLQRRRGRASTILTSPQGTGSTLLGYRTLLGR